MTADAQVPARSLILDIYGAYVRRMGGWLAVAALVELMAGVGHDQAAVRAAVSRMKRSALLEAQNRAGVAGYALTAQAAQILRDGDDRIFRPPATPDPDGRWILAVFSVPERSREHRHRLRGQLVRLGFGQVAPGAWIAPASTAEEARRMIERAGLARYVSLFDGRYRGCTELRTLVRQAWDLAAIDAAYRGFIAAHRRTAMRWRTAPRGDDKAFADHMRAIASWRRVAYLDPGLPAELMQSRWSGDAARALFAELHVTLSPRASAHVLRVARSGAAAAA